MPHRRRKSVVDEPDFCGRELSWYVEDAAVDQGEAALLDPP
jgi:hypothetical protein